MPVVLTKSSSSLKVSELDLPQRLTPWIEAIEGWDATGSAGPRQCFSRFLYLTKIYQFISIYLDPHATGAAGPRHFFVFVTSPKMYIIQKWDGK